MHVVIRLPVADLNRVPDIAVIEAVLAGSGGHVNQVVGIALCWFVGQRLVQPLVDWMTTKRAIIVGLLIYVVIAIWGYFLTTAAEFWMLAWLVGTVQGGTQALSRSLYSTLSPASKSGEFFGFYGFSDKFAGILGPLHPSSLYR